MSENRCVCCNAVISEGRQCCPACVAKYMDQESRFRYRGKATLANSAILEKTGTLTEMTQWADWVLQGDDIREINIWRLKDGEKAVE